MDKWIKKLSKLGKKFTVPDSAFKNNKAAFLKVVDRSSAEVVNPLSLSLYHNYPSGQRGWSARLNAPATSGAGR